MIRRFLLPLAFLAGCGAEPALFTAPVSQPTERVAISYRSVSVLDVSLPVYAASQEIALIAPGGALESSGDNLWADEPERAVTLALTRTLTQISGARIVPEPWPFQGFPDAVLDIRVEEMLGDAGVYRLSGQYFVAPEDARRRDVARLFALDVHYDTEAGLAAVAAARSEAILQLATLIAREGLR